MLFLSGKLIPDLPSRHPDLGTMVTAASYRKAAMPTYGAWAADTGCFADPEGFRLGEYIAWLHETTAEYGAPLFATAPDRYDDGRTTLRVALGAMPYIREAGVPVALVVQPGIPTPLPWGEFDALFVGGPNAWQRSEACLDLVREARRRGMWTHKGRVNTFGRIAAAKASGLFDSVDGTLLAFGTELNLPRLLRWMRELDGQQTLALA